MLISFGSERNVPVVRNIYLKRCFLVEEVLFQMRSPEVLCSSLSEHASLLSTCSLPDQKRRKATKLSGYLESCCRFW